MFSINDSFIGYNENFRYEKFSGSDDAELYEKSLKLQPIDWYYRTANIEYKRNSLGHRTKEINDTNLDNYILSVGCSFTEGIGLENDKTYTHVLANMLGCDYYNMGLGGHSMLTSIHNTVIWFNKIKKKPKLLIVQSPDITRFPVFFDTDTRSNNIGSTTINSKNPKFVEFIIAGDQVNYWQTTYKLYMLQFKSFGVPIIELCYHNLREEFPNRSEDQKEKIDFVSIDYGRDSHSGIETNRKLAQSIYDKYCNA